MPNGGPDFPLEESHTEWVDASGGPVQVCVVHTFDPNKKYEAKAIVVIDGLSLCREHAKVILLKMANGHKPAHIALGILSGEYV